MIISPSNKSILLQVYGRRVVIIPYQQYLQFYMQKQLHKREKKKSERTVWTNFSFHV